MSRRPLPNVDQPERASQILALPTIRRLVLENKISLATSRELKFEACPTGGGHGTMGDLFAGLQVLDIPPPIDRSFFQQLPIEEYLQRAAMQEFCVFLLGLTAEAAERFVQLLPELPNPSVEGLGDILRFHQLAEHAPMKHLPDIYHLWTAERGDCAYFLTLDANS